MYCRQRSTLRRPDFGPKDGEHLNAVLGFQHRADAEQFLRDWKERLSRFGLELHPDKTRLIEFGRFAVANRKERGEGKPETFNFLGFTHICGQTWKIGKFQLLRKTIHQRLSAKLRALKEELRRRKHLSVAELGKWLSPLYRATSTIMQFPGIWPAFGVFGYR